MNTKVKTDAANTEAANTEAANTEAHETVKEKAQHAVESTKGFFKKHGLNTTLAKENGWGAARDKVVSGENHGSHLKYAQPLGQTVGVLGGAKTTIVAPYTLCRGGSVFMASIKLKDRLTIDPQTWKSVADELRANGEAYAWGLDVYGLGNQPATGTFQPRPRVIKSAGGGAAWTDW